jgi:pullulanase
MRVDLFQRKLTHFVLWRGSSPVILYIGKRGDKFQEIPLAPSSQFPELWEIAAQDCNLEEQQVYHYWFKVSNTNPYFGGEPSYYCTDPIAYTVDRHTPAPDSNAAPASVILYREGKLFPCDPQGGTVKWDAPQAPLAANHQLVIYELPTRWAKQQQGEKIIGNGTFRDVRSLLPTHLTQLGINALELLPPADSDDKDNWGYGTAHFFAADCDLGTSGTESTASVDLAELIQSCHQQGIRFFVDMVMAFARSNPYRHINFADFFVEWNALLGLMPDPEQRSRDGFGGDLFKFNYWVDGYHPIAGTSSQFVPAREYLKLYLIHWMLYYRVDGLRLDSVNNIDNYDFLQEFKDLARQVWQAQGGTDDRFLVVGEELSVPLALVHQNRLDGLWNEHFKQLLRLVILGRSLENESFETTVRKLIDCRLLGFRDGTQAVNYVTSHDVGGYQNERLYDFLINSGVIEAEPRIKLAFVCLMTAVGIPMIFAGEEFADQHDLNLNEFDHKQIDPVNYSRMAEEWRSHLFQYVARLTHFRTTSAALATNDTNFIHVDFEAGKRVLVWRRGYGEQIVVVVANFSDYGTPPQPNAEYVIPNFPETPFRKQWREVTGDRIVPAEWIGREPIFPWEAKVYALVERIPYPQT